MPNAVFSSQAHITLTNYSHLSIILVSHRTLTPQPHIYSVLFLLIHKLLGTSDSFWGYLGKVLLIGHSFQVLVNLITVVCLAGMRAIK